MNLKNVRHKKWAGGKKEKPFVDYQPLKNFQQGFDWLGCLGCQDILYVIDAEKLQWNESLMIL